MVSSSALPTGAATAALQSTLNGHVDGIEGLLGTIDADTSSIAADAATLAGAVAAGQFQVDLVGITPDLMLGTDFSAVLGAASLVLATQADDVANTTDALVTASFGYVFDGTAWDRLRGDAVNGVLVNLGANNDVAVTGSVTANAGTNLNTSALALESGGVLDSLATLLGTIDADTGSIATDAATLAGTVAGSEMQADVVTMPGTAAEAAALPAAFVVVAGDDGTDTHPLQVDASGFLKAILQANSGVDIGDVDVTSVPADPFGADADAAAVDGSISAKLRSLATNLAAVIAGSEAQVDVVSSALPTGAATAANQATLVSQTQPAQSHYRNIDANAEAEIKGSAGTLFWIQAMNLTAAKAYVHLYDATAASVTPGSTTPTYTFPIPTQGDTNGAGFNFSFGPTGQAFANGITLVVTTTIDGSAGDPGTNGVFVNAGYT